VVYAVDAAGAALGGAQVNTSTSSAPSAMPGGTMTDRYGVAHVSVAPGQEATITVSMAGFSTAVSRPLRAPAGEIVTLTAVLEVDPKAILDVFPDLSQ
jgi:hypothetical protein